MLKGTAAVLGSAFAFAAPTIMGLDLVAEANVRLARSEARSARTLSSGRR